MQVRIPFVYPLTLRAPGARKSEKVWYREILEGDVEGLPDDAAPVALRWETEIRTENRMHEIRHRDGIFYERTYPREHAARFAEFLRGTGRDMPGMGFRLKELIGLKYFDFDWHRFDDAKPLDPSTRSRVIASQRDEYIERARRMIANLVVVDGELWTRVEQPLLAVNQVRHTPNRFSDVGARDVADVSVHLKGPARSPLHRGEETTGGRARGPLWTMLFRIDQWEEAMAAAEDMRSPPGDGDRFRKAEETFTDLKARPEVLMPEVFSFSPGADIADRVASSLLAKVRRRLSEQDRDLVSAWLDLRDAHARACADPSPSRQLDLLAKSRELVERPPPNMTVAWLDMVIARWERWSGGEADNTPIVMPSPGR